MKPRERILAIAIVALLAGAVLYFAVNRLWIQPQAQMDKDAAKLRTDIATLQKGNEKKGQYARQLASLVAKVFDVDDNRASEASKSRLLALTQRSGLRADIMLSPLVGVREQNTYKEIGWTVVASGSLEAVINFLYLLDAEPYLQRVDNVWLSPDKIRNEVSLTLRYTTLVPAAEVMKLVATSRPATEPASEPTEAPLNTEARMAYNVIKDRQLFLPYVKAPPPPPAAPPAPTVAVTPRGPGVDPPPTPKGPGIERFRVVGLPAFGAKPDQVEVFIIDTSRGGESRSYKIGEEVEGSRIVMVDYRPLPNPRTPDLLSPSRVILKNGPDYWAVELGETFADKRALSPSELPEGLRPAATQSAAGPSAPEPGKVR